MFVTKSETVTRVARHEVELDRDQLLEMLRAAGADLPEDVGHVRIYFAVPGGGDWSNTDVDIDKSNPVRAEWSVVTEARHGC